MADRVSARIMIGGILPRSLLEDFTHNLADDNDPDPPSPELLAAFPPGDDDLWSGLRTIFADPNFPCLGAQLEGGNTLAEPHRSQAVIYGTTDFQPDAVASLIQRCCRGQHRTGANRLRILLDLLEAARRRVRWWLVRHSFRPHRQRLHQRRTRHRAAALTFPDPIFARQSPPSAGRWRASLPPRQGSDP